MLAHMEEALPAAYTDLPGGWKSSDSGFPIDLEGRSSHRKLQAPWMWLQERHPGLFPGSPKPSWSTESSYAEVFHTSWLRRRGSSARVLLDWVQATLAPGSSLGLLRSGSLTELGGFLFLPGDHLL